MSIPVIAFFNNKGGVGKTTVAGNLLSYFAKKRGLRVLVIDLDYQGSLSGKCLDRKHMSKLAAQERLVQELFKKSQPDAKMIIQLAHEVTDAEWALYGFVV